mgnify:CR=1 FL=1
MKLSGKRRYLMKIKKTDRKGIKDSLKTVKALSKFKNRETCGKGYGPTMLVKASKTYRIVNYVSPVLFSELMNKSILSSIFSDWIYALSSVAPWGRNSREVILSQTENSINSDLFG